MLGFWCLRIFWGIESKLLSFLLALLIQLPKLLSLQLPGVHALKVASGNLLPTCSWPCRNQTSHLGHTCWRPRMDRVDHDWSTLSKLSKQWTILIGDGFKWISPVFPRLFMKHEGSLWPHSPVAEVSFKQRHYCLPARRPGDGKELATEDARGQGWVWDRLGIALSGHIWLAVWGTVDVKVGNQQALRYMEPRLETPIHMTWHLVILSPKPFLWMVSEYDPYALQINVTQCYSTWRGTTAWSTKLKNAGHALPKPRVYNVLLFQMIIWWGTFFLLRRTTHHILYIPVYPHYRPCYVPIFFMYIYIYIYALIFT